jgi:uncharacterized protein GlcG (DUF336 family)
MRKVLLTATAALLAATASAAKAQSEDALVSFQVLSPDLAVELASSTMRACREKGFQVAAAVVDRFGVPQALARDRFAGAHTPDTAIRKAWTAVSFRSNTADLVEPTASGTPQAGARDIPNALMLGGGVLIEVAGQIVGGLGVSGAPSGEDDHGCAQDGIAAIQDRLPL